MNELIIKPGANQNLSDEISDMYPFEDISADNNEEDNPVDDKSKEIAMLASFEKLKRVNPDVRGFIKIEGTVINYPIVQSSDNEYYLKYNFYNKYSSYGTLFFDYRNKIDKTDKNLIIHGHQMRDGQMFGTLEKYKNLDYYKEHPVFRLDTVAEPGQYKIISAFYASTLPKHAPNFYYLYTDFSSDDEFMEFVQDVRDRSMIDTPVDVIESDRIVTLSTCSTLFEEARFVVIARRVRPDELPEVDLSKAKANSDVVMPKV